MFQCRERHFHVHNVDNEYISLSSLVVSMPRTAFPCAQPPQDDPAETRRHVSMPRTAFPCAQLRLSKPMISLAPERRFGKPQPFFEKRPDTFAESCPVSSGQGGEKPHAAGLAMSAPKLENLRPIRVLMRFSSFRIIPYPLRNSNASMIFSLPFILRKEIYKK